jgi:hypothetical protein
MEHVWSKYFSQDWETIFVIEESTWDKGRCSRLHISARNGCKQADYIGT